MNCFKASISGLQDALCKVSVLISKDRAKLDDAIYQEVSSKEMRIVELLSQTD